jgi:hypothetical protein
MGDVVPLEQKQNEVIQLDDDILKLSGIGSEKVKTQNVLIPRLVILQALSPQVNRKKPEYIEGAEVGDFCNTATGDIHKGSVTVVPCYFITNYLEWIKNRGGLSMNYGDDPSCLQRAQRNEINQNILPNGNIIEETAQWYCLLNTGGIWERLFFPLVRTNLKHSRKWMTLCQSENIQTKDKDGNLTMWKPPLFWRSWNLFIVDASNDRGDWLTFRPEKRETILEIDPKKTLLNMCKAFHADLVGGKVKGDIESTHEDSNGNGRRVDPNADIPF